MDKIIKQFSPLTEATFYILVALTEPLHGYGVIKKVERMTNNRMNLAAGTLYGAFNSLQKNRLIELMGVDKDNPRRKLYQMTDIGRQLIEYEIQRLSGMVQQGKNELGGNYEYND